MTAQDGNPYRRFIERFTENVEEAKQYPLGGFEPEPTASLKGSRGPLVHFSPHPDDECLIGALPLRLLRDSDIRVVNVPVTFGSNLARRAERAIELRNACEYVGFEIRSMRDGGFSDISPKGRAQNPANWAEAVGAAADVLEAERPSVVLIPHREEFNPTHQGTNELVMEGLARQDPSYSCYVIEWEYWTPLTEPNLLLEVSRDDLATLIAAVSFHAGEVTRNPQHVNMPAWMQDNVRRGAELVGNPGDVAPEYEFGLIYRLRKWTSGDLADCLDGGVFVSASDDLASVLPDVHR